MNKALLVSIVCFALALIVLNTSIIFSPQTSDNGLKLMQPPVENSFPESSENTINLGTSEINKDEKTVEENSLRDDFQGNDDGRDDDEQDKDKHDNRQGGGNGNPQQISFAAESASSYAPIVRSIQKAAQKMNDEIFSLNEEIAANGIPGYTTVLITGDQARLDEIVQLSKSLGLTVADRFDFIGTIAVEVPNSNFMETLVDLGSSDSVDGIFKNNELQPLLKEAVPLVSGSYMWSQLDSLGRNVTGKNVTIAIFDTGIQYNHSAFNCTYAQIMSRTCPKIVDSWNFRNTSLTYDVYDTNGHGTHVAGIAASQGGIDPAMKGMAPDSKLAVFKVCGDFGCNTNDIIAAVGHAIDPNGDNNTADRYDIFSLSIGSTGMSPDHPLSVALDQAYNAGAVVVVAAGNLGLNGNNTIECPACAKSAIAVGASTKTDGIWSDSSRGFYSYGSYAMAKPNIVAPGMDINSSYDDYGYKLQSGTSMAAPMVAGAAALLKQMHPSWSNGIVRSALTTMADDIGFVWRSEGVGRLNLTKSSGIKAWFAPAAAEFGVFNDVMQHYYNRSVVLNITSINESAVYYDISVFRYDAEASYSVNIDKNSINLGAFAADIINITIDCDYNLTTKDFHAGYIRINSSTETYRIPWIFKKEGDYLNNVPVANAGYNFFAYNGTVALLNGSGSSDADNDTLTYNWTRFLGSTFTLDDKTLREPRFNTLPETIGTAPFFSGNYTVWKLIVSDGKATSTDYVDVRVSMWDFYSEHSKLWYENFSSEKRIDYRDNEGYASGTVSYSVPATMPKLRQQFKSTDDASSIRLCSKTTYMDTFRDVNQTFTICKKDSGVNCLTNTMSPLFIIHGPPEFIDRCTPFFDYPINEGDYYLTSIGLENLTDMVYSRFYIYTTQITDYWYTFTGSSISQEIPNTATPDGSRRQLALGIYKGIGTDAGQLQIYQQGDLVKLDFQSQYAVTFQNMTAGANVNSTGYWQTTAGTFPGDYVVRVTIDNGAISEYRDVTIRVFGSLAAPVISPIADKQVNEGQLLSVEVNATDAYSPLMYYINDTRFSHPGGISSKIFTWTPSLSDEGNYSFKVNVSNGLNQSTAVFNVEVLDYVAPPNSAPDIIAIASNSNYEGETFTASVYAIDIDNDTISYSINDTRFSQSGNVFSWLTSSSDIGRHSVTFNVTDGMATASQEYNFTIKNKFILRLATAKRESQYYDNVQNDWIKPSSIAVSSIAGTSAKTANYAANFTAWSDALITFTNSASGYIADTDKIYLDNGLASCSGASCSFSTAGYSTSCTQKLDPEYYDCYLTGSNIDGTMGFLWSPLYNTVWKINYLLKRI